MSLKFASSKIKVNNSHEFDFSGLSAGSYAVGLSGFSLALTGSDSHEISQMQVHLEVDGGTVQFKGIFSQVGHNYTLSGGSSVNVTAMYTSDQNPDVFLTTMRSVSERSQPPVSLPGKSEDPVTFLTGFNFEIPGADNAEKVSRISVSGGVSPSSGSELQLTASTTWLPQGTMQGTVDLGLLAPLNNNLLFTTQVKNVPIKVHKDVPIEAHVDVPMGICIHHAAVFLAGFTTAYPKGKDYEFFSIEVNAEVEPIKKDTDTVTIRVTNLLTDRDGPGGDVNNNPESSTTVLVIGTHAPKVLSGGHTLYSQKWETYLADTGNTVDQEKAGSSWQVDRVSRSDARTPSTALKFGDIVTLSVFNSEGQPAYLSVQGKSVSLEAPSSPGLQQQWKLVNPNDLNSTNYITQTDPVSLQSLVQTGDKKNQYQYLSAQKNNTIELKDWAREWEHWLFDFASNQN